MKRLAELGLWVALVGVGLGIGLVGCEKDQPIISSPGSSPSAGEDDGGSPSPVVIEQPGVAPTPTPANPEPTPEPEPAFGTTKIVVSDVACQTDADCRKSTCCHATSCVAAADAPDCSTTPCTMDCRGGTMDCNGGCACQAGKCAATLWWAGSP